MFVECVFVFIFCGFGIGEIVGCYKSVVVVVVIVIISGMCFIGVVIVWFCYFLV